MNGNRFATLCAGFVIGYGGMLWSFGHARIGAAIAFAVLLIASSLGLAYGTSRHG